jgi:hypothetical protein
MAKMTNVYTPNKILETAQRILADTDEKIKAGVILTHREEQQRKIATVIVNKETK